MEARTPPVIQARVAPAPASQTRSFLSRWRERAPHVAAIAVTAMAGISCVLGISWLAVISANAERGGIAGLTPWAIGCAVLAVGAFAVGLAALLRPSLRVTLVAVASFLMILLVTSVIAFTMSATPQELDVRPAGTVASDGK